MMQPRLMKPFGEALEQRNIIIKIGDKLSMSGFAQVPNAVLKSDAISAGAKLVYVPLLFYA